jgi:hypothetical protein
MKLSALPQKAFHFAARVRKWWAASCLGLCLLPGLGRVGEARAQAPAPQLPPKSYMNKQVFYLPVIIDDRIRAGLREIQLYGKDHPSRPWVLKAKEGPGATVFPFRPAHDGEYWFTVVTIDKSGRPNPADVQREGPGVIVVHDTQAPQVDIRQLQATPEGQLVQCEVRDGNPEPAKTRFEYQTADMVWRCGDVVPNQPDTFIIPAQAMFSGLVRVTAVDRAGNKTERELNLGNNAPSLNVATGGAPSCPASPCPATGEGHAPKNLPPTVVSQAQVIPGQGDGPILPAAPEVKTQPKVDPQIQHTAARSPAAPEAIPARPQPAERSVVPAGPRGSAVAATRKIINTTHVTLEYQIEQAGASGVGKVEVWVTSDHGQSWQKLADDPDRRSPVEVDLPGEGVYGVSLVVSNGRGFGATPPAPGDAPDGWIEVDVTKPFVELVSVRPGTDGDAAALWITWTARDKNLAAEPVDLYYSPNRDGPWTVIAKGVRNDGRYRWAAPAEMPLAFVRVAVTDKAGNSSKCDTPQAVALDDMSRPHGRVVDIVPQAAPTSPGAAVQGN